MTTDVPGHSCETSHLMFGVREGVREIPSPLKLGELSQELRSLLWEVTYDSLTQSVSHSPMGRSWLSSPWNEILSRRHVLVLHQPKDEFSNDHTYHIGLLKVLFFQETYVEVFEFLEFVMRSSDCPYGFSESISQALKDARAAYVVVDGRTIFPTATEEQAEALQSAFDNLKDESFTGARSHLLAAGQELNDGNYASSIRESIHAGESISRSIVPETKALAPALAALEARSQLHGALKKGFAALYGFTCEEQGIRHPLLDQDEAQVDQDSAVFMLGACASFVSYLANKGREAGLISQGMR